MAKVLEWCWPENWDHGFESRSRHGCMYVHISLCCVVLGRLKPYDGQIPHPKSPTKMSVRIHSFGS